MKQQRVEWIDIAKGIGILLVVLGHVTSPVMEGYPVIQAAYRVLYAFHMPLFFLLSGLVCGKLVRAEAGQKGMLILQRSKRLMLPYATWAVIYIPMKLVMKDQLRFDPAPVWTVLLGNNPAGQLWFLYVLFLLSVITILFVNKKNLKIWCILGCVASFVSPLVPVTLAYPGISLQFSLYQVGFFFLGLLLTDRREDFFNDPVLAAVFAVIWAACGFTKAINLNLWYLNAVGAAGACYVICFLTNRLKHGFAHRMLTGLGKQSMEIYILHAPILVVCRIVVRPFLGNLPWLYIPVVTGVSIAISVLATRWVINKIKPLRFILFGG